MSYRVLRGRWCKIIDLNVHVLSNEESYVSKDSFCEELEQVFHHFLKYHIKVLLQILMKNWGERIFPNLKLGIRVYIKKIMIMVLE
jgi:hypothetical protein